MTSNIERELKDRAARMAKPMSDPPSAKQLSQTVRKRRHRQMVIRQTAVGGCAVAACVLFFFRTNEPAKENAAENAIVAVGPDHGVLDTNDVLDPASIKTPAMSPKQIEQKIRLLAKVRQPVPVFEVDEQSQSMRYVGWVEDELQVPVDLDHMPSEQRASFRKALYEPVRYDL